jgi:hypothetical protein
MARRHHDLGGTPGGPIDRTDRPLEDWEILADVLSRSVGAVRTPDEQRRTREDMPKELYFSLGYYERWIYTLEENLVEKKVLTHEEIDRKVKELEKKWGKA